MTLEIGDVAGEDWRAQQVTVEWLPAEAPALRVRLRRLDFDTALGPLEDLTVSCRAPDIQPARFACAEARIEGRLGALGHQRLQGAVSYDTARGALEFSVRDIRLAGGAARAHGAWRASGWRLALAVDKVALERLRILAAPWFELPKEVELRGRGALQATVRGARTVQQIDTVLSVEELTAHNAAGTLATDGLGIEAQVRLRSAGADWQVEGTLRTGAGQFYRDPIFVDLSAHPLDATFAGLWRREQAALEIEHLGLKQRDILEAQVTGMLDFAGTQRAQALRVEVQALHFPGAYAVLMQPFLVATDLRELDTQGTIAGEVFIRADEIAALDLTVQDFTARDRGGRMGITGLAGRVAWAEEDRPGPSASQLTWRSAHAYGLTGSGARLRFITSGADFRLLEPTYLPILDGGLFVSTLNMREIGAEAMSLRFEGELQPIGMPLLCRAFGWPEFSGTLSGHIPEINYDAGVLSLGGALDARAFGGRLTVESLELSDPLGRYPRLKADVTLRGLDLQAVTGTFSFGTITGRLDGEIRDLELFRWRPVRMNARLYTPPDDDSRHIISQRAVKNLSSIGGGGGSVAAALQSGFLRFFEHFRYRRLGLSCRLENELCYMDGIARAAGDAYYIVQGSGIPRIDIIGNARRVDWPVLVEQLMSIDKSGGPVVR